jgi:hypothetical protein
MKTYIILAGAMFAPLCAEAAGIKGRVVSESGYGKKGVTVTVTEHRITATTDSNGYYIIELPKGSENQRVTVKVNGKYAASPKVPKYGHATVDVTMNK